MKYLTIVLALLFSFNINAKTKIKLIGNVNQKLISDITHAFNEGVTVIEANVVFRIFPKNIADKIYTIINDAGFFEINFAPIYGGDGYDILNAKYVCNTYPCELQFYNHLSVYY